MPTLYEIISQMRIQHPGAHNAKTLDVVTEELGRTQDNLAAALDHLADRALPTGGRALLEELRARAEAAGVDEIITPRPRAEIMANAESVDGSQVGIAILLGGTAVAAVVLALLVVVQGLNQILHWF